MLVLSLEVVKNMALVLFVARQLSRRSLYYIGSLGVELKLPEMTGLPERPFENVELFMACASSSTRCEVGGLRLVRKSSESMHSPHLMFDMDVERAVPLLNSFSS